LVPVRPDTRALLRLSTLFYGVAGILAWAWALMFGQLDRLLGDRPPGAGDLGLGVLLGLSIVAGSALFWRLSERARRASRILGAFFGPIGVVPALYLAALSGFFEELMFRGALWPQLGLVGSAVLFGVLHTVPVRGLGIYPVFAAIAGFGLGLLRQHSGSIGPPVMAHFTINAINLTLLGRLEDRSTGRAPPPAPAPPPPIPLRPPPEDDAEADGGQPRIDAGVPDLGALDEEFPVTVWRYDLRVELRGTDRHTLPECLEHEELALFAHTARAEVYDRLREGRFVFTAAFPAPFASFPNDVATLSAYLFQPVVGIEVAERYVDEETTDDVRAWKVVGRRGEWVKVPLVVEATEGGRFLVDAEREDVEVLAARWTGYPRWFQDAMRLKYPRLREL